MKILKPEEILQPRGSLIPEQPGDVELPVGAISGTARGAIEAKLGESLQSLFLTHDATPYVQDIDLQRNGLFEPDDCVTCGYQNAIYTIHWAKFGVQLNKKSRRFTAIKSHTQPNAGNSYTNVENSIVNDGLVDEADCVSITPTTTLAQFFAAIPDDVTLKENFKAFYEIQSFWLPRQVNGMSAIKLDLWDFLEFAPIIVTVDGQYSYNKNGEVCRTSQNDSHCVLLMSVSTEQQPYYLVLDSENPTGLIKFEQYYDFHYPKVLFLTRKNMPILYKQNGQPAIYALDQEKKNLIAFGDGLISGGELFKALYNVSDYSKLVIKHVDSLPFPIAPYQFKTV